MPEIGMQLKRMAQEIRDKENRYMADKTPSVEETLFYPMRHFNSDSPITPGLLKSIPYNITDQPVQINYGGCMTLPPSLIGGGYYLWHNGQGIAIDPGFGFVDSLHRYNNLNVHCIHAIIITHDHLDHHADLETIINLRRGGSDVLKIFANQQVIAVYGLEQRQKIDALNIEVYIVPEEIGQLYSPVKIIDDVTAIFLPSLHWQRLRTIETLKNKKSLRFTPSELLKIHFNTFGIQLSMNNGERRILITSDTLFPINVKGSWMAYTDIYDPKKVPYLDPDNASKLGWKHTDLYNERKKILPLINERCMEMINIYNSLEKSDIVCLHVGSLEKNFSKLEDNTTLQQLLGKRNDHTYSYWGFHLGLIGSIRLTELLIKRKKFDYNKGVVILTEFGEELLGNRQNICMIFSKLINSLINNKTNAFAVLPSEVTLKLRIDHKQKDKSPGVVCSYCGRYHNWQDTAGHEGPGEIISYVAKGPNDRTHPNCAHWNI